MTQPSPHIKFPSRLMTDRQKKTVKSYVHRVERTLSTQSGRRGKTPSRIELEGYLCLLIAARVHKRFDDFHWNYMNRNASLVKPRTMINWLLFVEHVPELDWWDRTIHLGSTKNVLRSRLYNIFEMESIATDPTDLSLEVQDEVVHRLLAFNSTSHWSPRPSGRPRVRVAARPALCMDNPNDYYDIPRSEDDGPPYESDSGGEGEHFVSATDQIEPTFLWENGCEDSVISLDTMSISMDSVNIGDSVVDDEDGTGSLVLVRSSFVDDHDDLSSFEEISVRSSSTLMLDEWDVMSDVQHHSVFSGIPPVSYREALLLRPPSLQTPQSVAVEGAPKLKSSRFSPTRENKSERTVQHVADDQYFDAHFIMDGVKGNRRRRAKERFKGCSS